MSNPNGFTFEWVAQAAGLKPREVKVIGYCDKCYSDLTEKDESCNCFPAIPSIYIVDEIQDEEDQMEYERTVL